VPRDDLTLRILAEQGAAEARRNPGATVRRLAELLERAGVPIEDIGRITRVSAWQGFMAKEVACADCGGEGCRACAGTGKARVPEVVDMVGLQLAPTWADGPAWPVVQPAAPTVVRPRRPAAKRPEGTRVTVLLPDTQIGYRRYGDGELDPMHDEAAMDVALQIVAAARPDAVVNLGDLLDLAEWSAKFVQWPEFALTTQAALDRAHRWLAAQRAEAGPEAEIVLLGGNHDDRLAKAVTRNAMAALRLRRAEAPASWPVLSLPHLLRLDDIGVRYVGAYPAGRWRIAGASPPQTPLWAIHGERVDVAKQARLERQSYVQGHAHHVALHTATYEIDGRPEEVQAWSIGCLCRIDGAVPSTHSGIDDHGRPVRRWESWQQAVAVVTETPEGWWLEPVRIIAGRAFWRGKLYVARERQEEADGGRRG
jgi:hypothetical protein